MNFSSKIRKRSCPALLGPYIGPAVSASICPYGRNAEFALWQLRYHQVAELEKAGNYPDAIVQYEQCLKIAEQTENKAGMAKSLIAIGVIRTKLADPPLRRLSASH